MKKIWLLVVLVASLLTGCVVVPGYYDYDGYYGNGHGYWHGHGYGHEHGRGYGD